MSERQVDHVLDILTILRDDEDTNSEPIVSDRLI